MEGTKPDLFLRRRSSPFGETKGKERGTWLMVKYGTFGESEAYKSSPQNAIEG